MERRIPAKDVLPVLGYATLDQRAELIFWLAGALRAVARYKEAGLTIGETLEDKILLTAHDVREWLGQMLDGEQLCRSGSGGIRVDGFMVKGE